MPSSFNSLCWLPAAKYWRNYLPPTVECEQLLDMELHTCKVRLPFLFETFHVSLIIFVLFKIANYEKINKKSNSSENFQNKNL